MVACCRVSDGEEDKALLFLSVYGHERAQLTARDELSLDHMCEGCLQKDTRVIKILL